MQQTLSRKFIKFFLLWSITVIESIKTLNLGEYMNLSSVGAVLTSETQRQTLEKVNVSLLKQSHEQQEDLTSQLLQSVAPTSASNSDSNLGQHVDIKV